jgi:hypothetical protein
VQPSRVPLRIENGCFKCFCNCRLSFVVVRLSFGPCCAIQATQLLDFDDGVAEDEEEESKVQRDVSSVHSRRASYRPGFSVAPLTPAPCHVGPSIKAICISIVTSQTCLSCTISLEPATLSRRARLAASRFCQPQTQDTHQPSLSTTPLLLCTVTAPCYSPFTYSHMHLDCQRA